MAEIKIPFNVPAYTGNEEAYIQQAIRNRRYSGDGEFTHKCHSWLKDTFKSPCALLTTSCTHALEMAAMLCNIREGDEVIMPSYTFTSTANAFVMRGARIVFVDIRPDTMNIDETLIEAAITPRTRAIVPVHYAGVACEMDTIMDIAERHNLFVVEDAAQAIMSTYKGKLLGTFGHLGCFSFHETKNIQCGEGGALIVNDKNFIERAEILREKGTDRTKFWRGEIDKYSWIDIGSSYLPSEINAAFLFAQLEQAERITNDRLHIWNYYHDQLMLANIKDCIKLPHIHETCGHNAHMFYIKAKDTEERSKIIDHLKDHGIMSIFHYIPLHNSIAGKRFGRFSGIDRFTTIESEKLLRLPLFYGLDEKRAARITEALHAYSVNRIGV